MTLMSGVRRTLVTSHVGDLDAGVTTDRASLCSGRSMVSTFPWQGAVAAMATQVPPAASFGAEACWRLKHKYLIFYYKYFVLVMARLLQII